jgi:hypothetical protein
MAAGRWMLNGASVVLSKELKVLDGRARLLACVQSPRNLSAIVLLDLIEAHPEIRDSVLPSLRAAPLLPHGSGIALHYLFSLADPRKSDQFLLR